MARDRPLPPRPDLLRRPSGGFGWLEARLLHDGWLARLGPEPAAVLLLLALAADERGASFYGRQRMATLLSLDRTAIDRALARLLELGLVAQRPWHPGQPDGVWQLLPVPSHPRASGGPASIGDVIAQLGLQHPQDTR